MKRLLFISWIFLLSVSFGLTKMKADVRMPLIFGDHMVLHQPIQRLPSLDGLMPEKP